MAAPFKLLVFNDGFDEEDDFEVDLDDFDEELDPLFVFPSAGR